MFLCYFSFILPAAEKFFAGCVRKKYQDMGFDAKRSKPLYFNGARGFIFGGLIFDDR